MRRIPTKTRGRRLVGHPVSLRLPSELRAQVKSYARSRGLEEATAIRTLCAERLRELELTEDLRIAEQWQLEQALKSWDRLLGGELETFEPSEVRGLFASARARAVRATKRR